MIVQENHYDPFGQNLVDIETKGTPDDKGQYTGKERVDKFGLELTDYGARWYDAQLGRWHSVDPVNQYGSPYVAMGNNPVSHVDPDGQFALLLTGAILGGGLNMLANRHSINNFQDGLKYFAVGAIAGAAGAGVGGGVNSALGGGSFAEGFIGSNLARHSTGLIAGGLTGLSVGLTTGFINGAGNAMIQGSSVGEAFNVGGASAYKGAIAGGATGAATGAIDAALRGRNILTGNAIQYKLPELLTANASDVILTAEDFYNDDFTVSNGSSSDAYYKPEDGQYGLGNKIRPGYGIKVPVDGIATSLHKDQVFKVPGKAGAQPKVFINPGGRVKIVFDNWSGLLLTGKIIKEAFRLNAYNYGWMARDQLDSNWDMLFKLARRIK